VSNQVVITPIDSNVSIVSDGCVVDVTPQPAVIQITSSGPSSSTDTDAIHDNVAGEIAAISEKASPVSADLVVIEDSADSNNKKRVQVGNLPVGTHTHATSDITSGTFADARIAESNVTQHEAALTITESQVSDLQSYLLNVVEDKTPQLGGSLDVNGNKLVSTSNGNIDIEPNGTGNVLLGNFTFDADQSVGAGQDDYVLTYDHSTGLISLEVSSGGGGGTPGGSDTQIQYNDGGSFGGVAGFAWDDAANELLITAQAASDTPVNIRAAASQTANLQEWQDNSGTAFARITNDGEFSNTGGETGCEVFGDGAVPGGTNNVLVGNGVTTDNTNCTVIGHNASATGTGQTVIGRAASATYAGSGNSVVIGNSASTTGQTAIVIGTSTSSSGSSTVTIGDGANTGNSNNVAIGKGSDASGGNAVAIGKDATTTFGGNINAVALGDNATCSAQSTTALGRNSQATGTQATAVGNDAVASATEACAFGFSADSSHTSSICIGARTESTANFQCVIGHANAPITNFYIGEGVTSASPQDLLLSATGASGTNVSAADLEIAAGAATGNAAGGSLKLQTSQAGASGTTLQTLSTVLQVDPDDKLGLFGATPVVQPSGTGETTGFTAGSGTGVNDDSTFTGNVGSTAYRISDIVKALKNLGLLAS